MKEKIRLTVRAAALAQGIEKPYHLAQKADISTSMAKAVWDAPVFPPERGNGTQRLPDLRTLWRIAKALQCDLGDLVKFSGTKNGAKASRSGRS